MSKILSFIALPLSILIALKYFKVYDANLAIGFDIATIGALFLIVMQLLSYVIVSSSNEGTSGIGKFIKTVLAVPGILYLINYVFPLSFTGELEIIVALFLFTEGIYGLH